MSSNLEFCCPRCGAASEEFVGGKCRFCDFDLAVEEPKYMKEKAEQAKIAGQATQEVWELGQVLLDNAFLMDANALLKTGLIHASGIGQAKNIALSKQLLTVAATKGSRDAMYNLGKVFEDNAKTSEDLEKAVFWYVQASKLGSIEARNTLAQRLGGQIEMVTDEQAILKTKSKLKGSNGGGGQIKAAVNGVMPFCVELTCLASSRETSCGSGVVVGEYVLTNAHVVINKNSREGKSPYSEIVLDFAKSISKNRYKLEVVCFDEREDIAILKFEGSAPTFEVAPPQLVSAHDMEVGDTVFTFGNALGRGLSLSTGVIAKQVEQGTYGRSEVIQTDMSINGGNSGGALFNSVGEIVGLMTFVPSDNKGRNHYGLSFAITSDTIAKFASKNEIML